MLKVVHLVNLVLAGLLAANELGTKVAVHPSLVRYPKLQHPEGPLLRHGG